MLQLWADTLTHSLHAVAESKRDMGTATPLGSHDIDSILAIGTLGRSIPSLERGPRRSIGRLDS